MFAVRTAAARTIRAPVAQSVRLMSTIEDAGQSWKNKEKAAEESYFKKIESEKRKAFAEKLHTKELRELLAILGPKHNLNENQIHDLLEWKHGTSA